MQLWFKIKSKRRLFKLKESTYDGDNLTATRLKEIRESTGIDQKSFAEMFNINKTTYNRYESGDIKRLQLNKIQEICDKFNINPAWLLGFKDIEKYWFPAKFYAKTKKIAVLGCIAAGIPILAQENITGYEDVPESANIDFCLEVKGDSMIGARIYDNDILFVRQQPTVENGEIAVVQIDNESATVKRFYKLDGSIILRAENPKYKDMIFDKKEAENVRVLGKVILLKGAVN